MPRSHHRAASLRSWALHAGTLAGAALCVALDRRIRRRTSIPVAVGAVSVAWYAAIALAERRAPYRDDWNDDHDGDTRADVAFVAATFATNLAVQSVSASIVRRVGVDAGVSRLPTPVGVAVAVLAYDLAHTLHHKLAHERGPAWKLHSVHHSPERLYWLNAPRFHVGEVAFDALVEGVIVGLLGLSHDQHTGFLAIRSLYGQVQHSNVDVRSGIWNRIFSTPDLHRWHHSVIYEEGDTNFGALTSVWDQVLGTFHLPDEPFAGTTGVGRMPEFPTSFTALQRVPLDWERIKEANAATWGGGA